MEDFMWDRLFRARFLLIVVAAIPMVACANSDNNLFGMGQREAIGTGGGVAAGALAGGLIAHNATGAVIGGVLGGIIGNRIGAYLDDNEKRRLALATNRAAESGKTGQKVSWSNPGPSGQGPTASGWVIPRSNAYINANGQTCRDMTQNVTKNGQNDSDDVTVCRSVSANGTSSWVIPQS
jgi:surface antigen